MKITSLLTDEVILSEVGQRIARHRLDRRLTQADLAERAGVAKRTLERLEAGASAQMSTVLRILRVLDLLPGLELMIPAPGPRPMDLLKHKGKTRKRAPSQRTSKSSKKTWTWGDDE